jgi:uncharacterized protein (DUF427 family)
MARRYGIIFSEVRLANVRFEECPRWVRAVLRGEVVIDSKRVRYGRSEAGPPFPVYWVPLEDVKVDRLEALGVREVLGPAVDGFVTFPWEPFDAILEESELVHVHPHDPRHRVDVRESERHVEVRVDGELIADSRRPKLLFETSLPTRYYLPRTDVKLEHLVRSDQRTGCAYKGFASYWSVKVGEKLYHDLVWSYETPLADAFPIAGLLCFWNEKVDLRVDGVQVGRGP